MLTAVHQNPFSGVRLTFPDVASAVEFETWMLASLLEVAAEEDGLPLTRLVDVLGHTDGIEYDEERDVFPALERLAEEMGEMEETALGEQAEGMAH